MISAKLYETIGEALTELLIDTKKEIEVLQTVTPNNSVMRRLAHLERKLVKLEDASSRFESRHHTFFWGHPFGQPSSLRGKWGAWRVEA